MKLTKKIIAGFVALAGLALLAGCSNDYSIVEYENGSTWDGEKLANTVPSTTYKLDLSSESTVNEGHFELKVLDNLTAGEYYTVKKADSTNGYRGVVITVGTNGSTISFDAENQGSSSRTMYISSSEPANAETTGALVTATMDTKGSTASASVTVDAGTYYLSSTGDLRLKTLSVNEPVLPEPRF